MDEKFVTRAFGTMGEEVISVRIIRNKMTGWVLILKWRFYTSCPPFM